MAMVVVAGLACARCAPTVEEVAAFDDGVCKSYGATFGSPAYIQCRTLRDQQRMAGAQAADAALLGSLTFQQPYVLPMPHR